MCGSSVLVLSVIKKALVFHLWWLYWKCHAVVNYTICLKSPVDFCNHFQNAILRCLLTDNDKFTYFPAKDNSTMCTCHLSLYQHSVHNHDLGQKYNVHVILRKIIWCRQKSTLVQVVFYWNAEVALNCMYLLVASYTILWIGTPFDYTFLLKIERGWFILSIVVFRLNYLSML